MGIGTTAVSLICLAMIAQAPAPKPAPPSGMPAPKGVYFLQAPGKWISLDPAYVDASKIKGMDTYIETDGYTALNMEYEYLGVSAPLQLTDRKPVFFVRGVGNPQYAQLVQLTKKKENRAVKTSSTEVSIGNRGGFKQSEIRPVTITALSDGSYSIVPVNDLKPGEYLLALGSAVIGYDFGIVSEKK